MNKMLILLFVNLVFYYTTFFSNTDKCVYINLSSKIIKKDTNNIPKAYNLFSVADSIIEKEGYKRALEELEGMEIFYKDAAEKGMFNQVMMTYESFNGANQEALRYESMLTPIKKEEKFIFPDEIIAMNAKEIINKYSRNKQVVMINEAHHRPQQRAFIKSLLNEFYGLGFKYLLVEAYSDIKDPLLNRRGYPIQKSGTYTREPMFAQLLREAHEIGFEIKSYDYDTISCSSPEPFFCNSQRDYYAALNVYNIIKQKPQSKILVLAGYSHIVEKSNDGWKKMAEQFKSISKIDPLSIDLVGMSERFNSDFENKYYIAANEKFKIKYPTILVNKTDSLSFLRNYTKDQIDLQVVFPRTKYLLSYPDWFAQQNEIVHEIIIPKNIFKKGDLLQIYIKGEFNENKRQAIPYLQFPLNDKKVYKLPLKRGIKYVIMIDNGKSQIKLKDY